jgi:adenylate cyclase
VTVSTSTSRVLTLVFTDLAGSTALKSQRGDVVVGELIARHREHLTRLAAEGGGSVIDWAGDGCFLTFATASAAVVFALRLQQIHKFEAELPGVRVGIHMGEVSLRELAGVPRVEGLIVDLAARISGLASAGQVLLSSAVGQSAKQRLGIYEFGQPVRWDNYGPYILKGFDEAVEICEAGLQGLSPPEAPRASEKAWPKSDGRSSAPVATAALDDVIRKIAVLPLANMSGDSSQEYFADGMTEAIITELAKIKALRVISRTSVMQYRNTTKTMTTVAQELGVDALVEGSVLRAGDDVRITAQLIRGSTDEHLWADSYEGTIAGIFKLQKEVALAIAKEINVTLTPAERSRIAGAPELKPEAYDVYLKAVRAFRNLRPADIQTAIELLQQAIDRAPNFAQAYATLAYAWWQAGTLGYGAAEDNYRRHRAAARAALRIDERHAGGNSALGWACLSSEWDWDEAEFRYLRAIEADANELSAYMGLAYLYVALGRSQEAFAYNEQHLQVAPQTFQPYHTMAVTRGLAGDMPKALECTQRALERQPRAVMTLLDGVWIAGCCRRMDLAEEWAARATEIVGRSARALSVWSTAHALAGDGKAAEALLAELETLARTQRVLPSDLAMPFVALGHHDRAMDALERAYAAKEHVMIFLGVAPFWNPLRGEPRFRALLRKMNFPAPIGGGTEPGQSHGGRGYLR